MEMPLAQPDPRPPRGEIANDAALRVLHVFPTFAPGGVQLRIADVANRLGPGVRHDCVALDGRDEALGRLAPETRWRMLEPPAGAGGWRGIGRIRRRVAEIAPDLLCTYNWGAIEWALAQCLRPRAAHLHFESGFGPEEATRLLPRRNLLRRVALRRVHRLVVPSRKLVDLATRHHWIPPERIALVPNGVDIHWYRPPARRPTESPKVLAVAPLRREKRLDRLIRLFDAATPDGTGELRLCGDGDCGRALRAQASACAAAGRIAFPGHVADIRPEGARAAVFAMTSETEQMPNALLQAMAMGLPVIAFDAGDIRHILPAAQRALVYPQDDEAGFRAGLRRLLDDAELRERLGAGNRAHVAQHHAMAEMVRAYRELYAEAVAGRR